MRLLQIIYFFFVGIPTFIIAYSMIEIIDFFKRLFVIKK